MKVVFIIEHVVYSSSLMGLLKGIVENGISLTFVSNTDNSSRFVCELEELGAQCYGYPIKNRLDKVNYIIYIDRILTQLRPDIINTSFFYPGAYVMPISWFSHGARRVHIRNHGNENHQVYPKSVLIDKLVNRCSELVVAISEQVAKVLVHQEELPPEKLRIIPHGLPLELYSQVTEVQKKSIQKKYEIKDTDFVVGFISRFTPLKGVHEMIGAFRKFQASVPQAKLIWANLPAGSQVEVRELLADVPEEAYRLIEFEEEIHALFACLSAFVHVPTNPSYEAFGKIYIEALAAKVPSVFTLSGIAHNLVLHEKNALVVPFQNIDAIYEALLRLYESPQLGAQLAEQGWVDVQEYRTEISVRRYLNLYEELLRL